MKHSLFTALVFYSTLRRNLSRANTKESKTASNYRSTDLERVFPNEIFKLKNFDNNNFIISDPNFCIFQHALRLFQHFAKKLSFNIIPGDNIEAVVRRCSSK